MKFILLTIFFCFCSKTYSLYCYWNTGCPYKYFSSKTPYNAVRGDIRDSKVILNGCEPISIWGLYRHGKRYPGIYFGKYMEDATGIRDYLVSSYESGNCALCAQDVDNIRYWPIDRRMFNPQEAEHLNEDGYQEMVNLGKRFKEAFPEILNDLKEGSYIFRPAKGQSVEKSIQGFVEGLNNKNLIIEKPKAGLDIMSPFLDCEKYQKEVRQNPNLYEEAYKYQQTPEYLAAKDRIMRRTGIRYNLNDQNITALYDLCRYSWSGVNSKISPWCALFTTDDLKVLEYLGDLRHYYRNGYGNPLNELLGRIPLSDLLTQFQKAKSGQGKKFVSYFTHATMLDMVYTALGLFKDKEALTGSYRNQKRNWWSSKIASFGSNFVATLNRCTLQDGSVDHNVVFYLNEEPLMSICKNRVCTWQEFEEKLKPFLNSSTDFC